MIKHGRFSLVVLFSVGCLVASHQVSQASEPVSCTDAVAWVDSQAVLPTTLEEISNIDVAYRREVYRRLNGNQRAALWLAHLDTFAPILNQEQLAVLSSIRTRITPALMASGGAGLLDIQRLKAVFNTPDHPNLAAQMFSMIGPSDGMDVMAKPGHAMACGCSMQSDYCPTSSSCQGGPNINCAVLAAGCGTLWAYTCDGVCLN